MAERNDEVVYLNNCELIIDSLTTIKAGTFYLVWKKGKKSTQSNRYQLTSDEPVSAKQTLSLSLKVYHSGTSALSRHTHLILFNNNGQQLGRMKLMINEWTGQLKERVIQLGGITIKLKMKRRSIMKLEKFHRLRSEVEQTSDDEGGRFLRRISGKTSQVEKQQLIRLTRQTDDQKFLIQKLKEQRNSGLVRIQKLEQQLGKVEERMRKDLTKIRQYYNLKIEMRQSVYKQQIQHLITAFNRNYELNYSLMEGLIKQKYDYQQEIEELKEDNQQFISNQQANFQRIISEMELHKKKVDEQLKDSNKKIQQKQNLIIQLNNQLDQLNTDLQQLRDSNKKLQEDFVREGTQYAHQVQERNVKIAEYQDIIQSDKLNIKNLTDDILHKQQDFLELNKLYDANLNEKTELDKMNLILNEEKEHLIIQNTTINNELLKLRQDLQEQNTQIQKLRENYELNTALLSKQLEDRVKVFGQELQNLRNENLNIHRDFQQKLQQNQILKQQVDQYIERLKGKQDQIQFYKNQMESDKEVHEHFLNESRENLQQYKALLDESNKRLGELLNEKTELEIENTQMKGELKELTFRSQEQQQRLRQEYQKMAESNKRLYQDEVQMIKTEKQEQSRQFQILKIEYETQMQKLMQGQKNQLQELDRMYKDQLDAKTKDQLELLQKNSKLVQQLEDLKLKVEIEKVKKENEKLFKKGKMPKNKWNAEQINEEDKEDDEDEPFQTVQVDSEQEEDEPIFLKKKPKSKPKAKPKPKPKKIIQPESEQIEDEEEQEQQEENQQSDSIVELMKLKGSRKSKLKKAHKIEIQQEEEQIQKSIQVVGSSQGSKKSQKEIGKQKQESSIQNVENFDQQQEEEKPQLLKKFSKKHSHSPKVIKKQSIKQSLITEQQLQQLKLQRDNLEGKVEKLEKQITDKNKNEKKLKQKYDKQEKRYQSKIKSLQQQIQNLNKQIQQLSASLGAENNKLLQQAKSNALSRKKQSESRKKITVPPIQIEISKPKVVIQEDPPSPASIKQKTKKSQPIASARSHKSPPKEFNQQHYINKIQNLQQDISSKQERIQRLQNRVKQLLKDVQKNKIESFEKQSMLQSKYLQVEKRDPRPSPIFSIDPTMKASIMNLQERVLSEKEKYQQLRLKYQSKNRQYQSMQTEFRKIKQKNEELQQKSKKQNVPRSLQELHNEIEEGNRKILELSRTINQVRLQRDSIQDQLRLTKKKFTQNSKSCQQWQSRALQGDRQLDDLKRRQQKYKRQFQQWKQQQKRLKDNIRRGQQELVEVRKSQSQFILQRKKILDEIVRLQGVVAQKQTQLNRSNKQVEKIRGKLNQDHQGRNGKQKQYKNQFQRLQIERSKLERKNRQLQQSVKQLKEKLQIAEKQSKKALQQRKMTYGQKLKRYIDEIMNVKRVVEDYQQQNSHLKIQNSQFFEQNQILKMSYQKLQLKYQQLIDHQARLQEQLAKYKQKQAELEQSRKKKQGDLTKLNELISTLRKQLDSERIASRKKSQKLQNYQQINERYLYEIKNFKIKLNDLQTNAQDATKINEQFYASQRTIDSLQQQLNKISQEYQQHSSKYLYTRDDVQQAIRELKEHQQKIKEQQLSRIVQELDQNHMNNRQNMENQLLLLYSENEKLRVSLQKVTEDALDFQQQLNQLEALREKCKNLEKDRHLLQRRAIQLADQLKLTQDQCRKLELKYNQSIRGQQGKNTENTTLLQKFQQLSKRYRELNQSYHELKIDDKRLLDKYKASSDEKDVALQKLASQMQGLSNKLLASELEANRLRQQQKISAEASYKKVKKLQAKIQEINQSNLQTLKQQQFKTKNQIRQLKNTISKYQQELSDKLHRIQQLNEGVLMLQSEVEQITAELTNARSQIAEDGQIYTIQINKLRNTMRQMEQHYDSNLRSLQEELSSMSKELTALKFSRQNNNTKLRTSRHSEGGDDKNARRFEDKIRAKDKRIQQLKETILILQEKIGEQAKSTSKESETQIYKIKIVEIQQTSRQSLSKKDIQISRLSQQIKKLQQQLLTCRSKEQQLNLLLQEKDLEQRSINSQLQMVSKLYNDLQRQIEKRKQNLNLQLKQQSFLKLQLQNKSKQLEMKLEIISQLQGKLKELENNLKQSKLQNKSMSFRIDQLERNKSQLLSVERRKLQGQSLAKLKITQQEKQIQSLRTESRKLRNQLNLSMKEAQNIKTQLNHKDIAITNLLRDVKSNDKKIDQDQKLIAKYISINEICLQKFELSLQDIVGYCTQLKQSLLQCETELQKISQQFEELKFMYERKYLDFQQLKKQNYEMVLKFQQRQINLNHLQILRDRNHWIEQQNKQLTFKQQAIKVQLQSLYSQMEGNSRETFKRRIADILADRYE